MTGMQRTCGEGCSACCYGDLSAGATEDTHPVECLNTQKTGTMSQQHQDSVHSVNNNTI